MAAFSFWMPMIFFFAADNMLATCESDLGGFMKIYSIISVVLPALLHFILTMFSLTGNPKLFKFGEFGVQVVSAIIGLILNILGLMQYNNTTDELCYDGELDLDHHINPRTLLYAWVIMGFIGFGCQGCAAPARLKGQE